MQHNALRGVWALHHARSSTSCALQQILTFLGPAQTLGTLSSPGDGQALTALGPLMNPSKSIATNISSCATYSTAAAVPSPSATLPTSATGAYSVEIAVQGFEKRYVDMACSAIDDIIMLAFAPKSYSALPTGAPAPADAPVNLAFGSHRRDVRLPWRRTRFSILKSPHVDKQGMEQFERREYKSVLTAATNSRAELQRLLEALKIYQFTGVQIRLDLTSAQQLELPVELDAVLTEARGGAAAAPGPRAAPAADGGAAPPRLLGSPTAAIPAPRRPEAQFEEELGSVLGLLRPLVWRGLQGRRQALDQVPEYSAWRQEQQRERGAVGAAGARVSRGAAGADGAMPAAARVDGADAELGGDGYGALLRRRLTQQLQHLRQLQADGAPASGEASDAASGGPPGAGAGAGAAASYGLEPGVAAELLARIDSELLQARSAALREGGAVAGGEVSTSDSSGSGGVWAGPPALDPQRMAPAEYAYAVLKYVQYVDWLAGQQGTAGTAGAGAGAAALEDRALQLAAPSLALRLLQLWWAATSAEFKQHLGLPPAEVEKRILEEQLRREEKARADKEARAKADAERRAAVAREWETEDDGFELEPSRGQGQGQGQKQGGRKSLFPSRRGESDED